MGEFLLKIDEQPQQVLHNTCHTEGLRLLWERCFGTGTDNIAFKLGLSCVNSPRNGWVWPMVGSSGDGNAKALPLAASVVLADIIADEGGWPSSDSLIRDEVAQYSRKSAAMMTEQVSGMAQVRSGNVLFTHQGDWDSLGCPAVKATHKRIGAYYWWEPDHDYPWCIPVFWPGRVGAVAEGSGTLSKPDPLDDYKLHLSGTVSADAATGMRVVVTKQTSDWSYTPLFGTLTSCGPTGFTATMDYPVSLYPDYLKGWYSIRPDSDLAEMADANAWHLVSLPIGCLFLSAEQDDSEGDPVTPALVASAILNHPVRWSPGQQWQVAYRGVAREMLGTAVILPAFAERAAQRMFKSVASYPWSSFQVGLGSGEIDELEPSTITLADVQEITGDGYARQSVSWALDPVDVSAYLAVVAWTNSGAENWPTIRNVFVVGDLGGGAELCLVIPVEAVTVEPLAPNNTFEVTDGKVYLHGVGRTSAGGGQ